MKKPLQRKLTVKKEKLRTLSSTELSAVGGGTEADSAWLSEDVQCVEGTVGCQP